MHEWSLARTLLQQATQICREQNCCRLLEVQVRIGPLSGIESCLLQSAFDQLVCEQGNGTTCLIVETTPLVVRCRDCQIETELAEFDFYCPVCHSKAVQVVQGDQLQLMSVKVSDEI